MTQVMRAWLLLVLVAGCFRLDSFGDDDDDAPPGTCGNGIVEDGEQCDDGNLANGDGCNASCYVEPHIAASWQLQTVAGTPVACPAAVDIAEVTLQPYQQGTCDSVPCPDTLFGTPTVLTGACASGNVAMYGQPGVGYRVTVRLVAAATQQVYAISVPQHVRANGASTASVAVPIYSDGGYLQLSWGFHDDTTNQGLGGCYDPPGSIDATISGPTQLAKTYLCTDWYDVIPLATGSYSVAMTGTPWQGGPVGVAATGTGIAVTGPITALDQVAIYEGVIHFSE